MFRVGGIAALLPVALLIATGCLADQALASGLHELDQVALPPGFTISYFASGLPNARSLALSQGDHSSNTSIVYVSTRRLSYVYAAVDEDGDGVADAITEVISDKQAPNGIAWRNGSLFVVTPGAVWRYDNADSYAVQGLAFPAAVMVYSDPVWDVSGHEWKFVAFGPDGKLYIPIGAPCNICDEELPYSSLLRMEPDGTAVETVARGIRNTVGFDWHPATRQLWFTDNGRDRMGDNLPDCELNVVVEGAGGSIPHYGYPFCHTGGNGDPYVRVVGVGDPVPDPQFNAGGLTQPCSQYISAVQALGPHTAPLGMRFYTGSMFPEAYRGGRSIFVALHGSWNRRDKIGYQVTHVRLDKDGTVVAHEPFATGWLQGQESWGRPVDVLVAPDGSLLVSDDDAGAVYRIAYDAEKATGEEGKDSKPDRHN